MSKVLGFVGLGAMGIPLSGRLLDAGYDVIGFDLNPVQLKEFVDRGGRAATSLKALADEAETILLSLPTPDIVDRVTLGEGGLSGGNAVKTIVDLSTTGSVMAASVNDRLKVSGIDFIDSPVSGGRGGAIKGTLAVMYSGSKAKFDVLHPVLSVFGKPFYVGDKAGQAQTMKLVNNLLSAAAMAATSEVVAMGVKAGLDPSIMIDVINAGSGMSTASRDKFPKSILTRNFDYGFATGLMFKDVRLCMEESRHLGVEMPVATSVHEAWKKTNDMLGAEKDFTTIIQMVEQSMGVVVKPHQK
jgi:3-hydroxyisobutyrate dehydrogenase-like beta-hydroxyacid dehydrogenase